MLKTSFNVRKPSGSVAVSFSGLEHQLFHQFVADPAPLHDFYREYFNLVDLADGHWYSVEEHHSHRRWECKMLLAILRSAVANTWVYAVNSSYESWKDRRKTLIKKLIQRAG